MQTLDVRSLVPADRHRTIFKQLAELDTGSGLRLVNDHDPKPLRYQLDAEFPGHYRWESVESGPHQWSIDITKRARVIDARPLIAQGTEPFETIMATVGELGDDEVFVVIAPFEPVPLEGVLSGQGFTYDVRELDGGDWQVTFTRA